MPIKVKPTDLVVRKWSTRAGGAAQNYIDGVNNPKQDQAAAAIAQASTWLAALTQAGTTAFTRGLEAAGTAKWQRKALGVGKDRYPGGIQGAIPDYTNKISQVLSVIEGVNLPPKAPRGDPANNQRSVAVQQSLRAAKVRGWRT